MRQILTHTSRSVEDVIELLKKGVFSYPNLPHYRYRQTQTSRSILSKHGFITATGKTSVGTNYVASKKFKEWQHEFDNGLTKLSPVKWDKQKKKEQK